MNGLKVGVGTLEGHCYYYAISILDTYYHEWVCPGKNWLVVPT